MRKKKRGEPKKNKREKNSLDCPKRKKKEKKRKKRDREHIRRHKLFISAETNHEIYHTLVILI